MPRRRGVLGAGSPDNNVVAVGRSDTSPLWPAAAAGLAGRQETISLSFTWLQADFSVEFGFFVLEATLEMAPTSQRSPISQRSQSKAAPPQPLAATALTSACWSVDRCGLMAARLRAAF